MTTVIFNVMRHGEKDGDRLTENGIVQVIDSAKLHLKNTIFDATFFSGLNRAKETVSHALKAIDQSSLISKMIEELGFGFEWANDDRWPIKDVLPIVEKLVVEGAEETADLWLQHWPSALAIRGRFLASMLGWARFLANTMDQKHISVLVGSHAPTGELAAVFPKTTPRLREADLITYLVKVNNLEATLINSEVFRAPY